MVLWDQLASPRYELMEQYATEKRKELGQGEASWLYWANHLVHRLSARSHHAPVLKARCVYRSKGDTSEEEVVTPFK